MEEDMIDEDTAHAVRYGQALERSKTEQTLRRYKEALERIEKFGHSHGHGRGYTCANIAEEALKND
jgi:hypothetical protein